MINSTNSDCLQKVMENRARLKKVIENIIYLGRQGIALRGHRDDGPINCESTKNGGNFRELLKFRANCGDVELKN